MKFAAVVANTKSPLDSPLLTVFEARDVNEAYRRALGAFKLNYIEDAIADGEGHWDLSLEDFKVILILKGVAAEAEIRGDGFSMVLGG